MGWEGLQKDISQFDISKSNGWSQSGNLTTGDPNNVITCQATKLVPQVYTVQFSTMFPAPGVNERSSAVADITWSVGGNDVRRQVSIQNGMSISGLAQAIKVSVRDTSILAATPPRAYPVNVLLSPGTRASVSQPPFIDGGTFRINEGSSQILNIPENVGVISTYVTVGLNGVTQDQIVTSVTPVFPSILGRSWNPLIIKGWVPLPPGANRQTISVSGGPSLNFATFGVAWGVDG